MLKIGIISSSAGTIERICNIAKTVLTPATYTFLACPYETVEEIEEILIKNNNHIDGWLFSGPNPYTVAKGFFHGKPDNSVYCCVTGNEIYKYLLETSYRLNKRKLAVSIDFPASGFFSYNESIELLDIPKDEVYVQEYRLPCDFSEIIAKHRSLWQAGKIDIVFTSLHLVHMALQRESIPVDRIQVSNTSIKQALYSLVQKLTGLHFKNSQVGFEIIAIRDYDTLVEKYGNYYKLQKLDLTIRQQLLELSQSLNGYLSEKGNGHYEIFASRGLIEENIFLLQKIIDKSSLVHKIDLLAGIGFSSTVYTAQLNARRALTYSKSADTIISILDEDGKMIEAAGIDKEFRFTAATLDLDIMQKLQTANVGIQTYNRILALVQKMHWETFTAAQVAQQLDVTGRNIQRILAGLNKAGLVLPAGQEALNKRGRPTIKYRLA